MRRLLLSFFLSFCFILLYGQNNNVRTFGLPLASQIDQSAPLSDVNFVDINLPQMYQKTALAPQRGKKNMSASNTTITLPINGTEKMVFRVLEASIFKPSMAAKYPQLKSYVVEGFNNPAYKGRISLNPNGVSALLYTPDGNLFIEPVNNTQHKVYTQIGSNLSDMACGIDDSETFFQSPDYIALESGRSATANGDSLLEFTLAIASSGEFSTTYGGTLASVNAQINVYLMALNTIFENELSVTFVLPSDNDDIIFFNSATDGINPSSRTASAHTVINGEIADYDLGHVFYTIPGSSISTSGVAGLGVVCSSSFKGRGWTGATASVPLNMFMGTFSHEIAHQFGAEHSYYGTDNNCIQRAAGSGYEPGSGNSLMSYEGSCNTHNITPEVSTLYFHIHSLLQMDTYISGISCYTTTLTGNSLPVAIAPADKTIPSGTPFTLEGSGTDADGDPLVYVWEQYDTDAMILSFPAGNPNDAATSTTAPLFRSFDPSATGNIRHFPKLSDVNSGTQTIGEILPTVDRTLHFRLTARDFKANGGGFHCDEVEITVEDDGGAFEVTSQPAAVTWTADGTATETVTWNVASTDLAPVSCPNVDILFSTDGGITYPHTILSGEANDGSATFIIPNYVTTQGRIKVACSDNYFWNINAANITITSSCAADGSTISPAIAVSAPTGDASLNLSLAPDFGAAVANFAGSVESTDDGNNLVFNNGGCNVSGNTVKYDEYEFYVDISGSYTINRAGVFGLVTNIYENSFDPNDPCATWIGSSGSLSGGLVNLGSTVTVPLTAGIPYVVVVSSFSSGTPSSLPAAYTVTFSGPAGSGVFDGLPPPGAAFDYTYVIVDNNLGTVEALDVNSDLSSSANFPGGSYTVYGLSLLTADLPTLNNWVGLSLPAFQDSLSLLRACGSLSLNSVDVDITCTSIPTAVASATGTFMADSECTDSDGWTYYWDGVNNVLLMAVKKNGNDIGRIGDGTMSVTVGVDAGSMTTTIPNTVPYVTQPTGWNVMSRYWDISPTTQPSSDVEVRFYYTPAEMTAMLAAATSAVSADELVWFKFASGSSINPDPNAGHAGATTADFVALTLSNSATITIDEYAQFAVSGFSGGGGGDGAGPLPVRLSKFVATNQGSHSLLEWTTESELNNDKFLIERSINGVDFEIIGEQKGAGTIEAVQQYFYKDFTPNTGLNYYRLAQVDFEGSMTHSNIEVVKFVQNGVLAVSPNPVGNSFMIDWENDQSGDVTYEIFDANGKLLLQNTVVAEKGINTWQISSEDFPKGIYFLKFATQSGIQTLRFIK